MRTRVEGLVQLRSGDAVKGVVSRRAFFWRFLKVEGSVQGKVTLLAVADPGNPTTADGVVWVPREQVSFVQEIVRVTA